MFNLEASFFDEHALNDQQQVVSQLGEYRGTKKACIAAGLLR
jgi:hypothetical protein